MIQPQKSVVLASAIKVSIGSLTGKLLLIDSTSFLKLQLTWSSIQCYSTYFFTSNLTLFPFYVLHVILVLFWSQLGQTSEENESKAHQQVIRQNLWMLEKLRNGNYDRAARWWHQSLPQLSVETISRKELTRWQLGRNLWVIAEKVERLKQD